LEWIISPDAKLVIPSEMMVGQSFCTGPHKKVLKGLASRPLLENYNKTYV
jgi:hypothetical protein